MSKRFYISDTHFGHKRVVEWRPFSTIEEHDNELINRWNSVVSSKDHIFHIGDFALCSAEKIKRLVPLLKGNIILIRGNHDRNSKFYYDLGFKDVYDVKPMKINETEVTLCHYPYFLGSRDYQENDWIRRNFRLFNFGTPLIHGHTHSLNPISGNSINVCVDAWDFYPASEDKIVNILRENEKENINDRKDNTR